MSAQHNLDGIDEYEGMKLGAWSDIFPIWGLYDRIKCVCSKVVCAPPW